MAITNDELLEDLKQFINAKVDGVEDRLGKRIDKVEGRLDGVEGRLVGVGGRLSSVEHRLSSVEEDIKEVKLVQNEILNFVGQDIQEVKDEQRKQDLRLKRLESKVA